MFKLRKKDRTSIKKKPEAKRVKFICPACGKVQETIDRPTDHPLIWRWECSKCGTKGKVTIEPLDWEDKRWWKMFLSD